MLTRFLLLYAATYVAVFAAAMLLVDAQTVPEPRLLTPLSVAVILGVTWLGQPSSAPNVRLVRSAVLASILVAQLGRLRPWMAAASSQGLGLRRVVDEEPMVQAVRSLPTSASVYSNRPYFMRFQTPRMVAGLPRARDPNTALPNQRHAQQLQRICDSAATRPTYIAVFDLDATEDSTAQGRRVMHAGDVQRLPGARLIRVRPGCAT